jgi:hypothetical protein
MGIYIFLAQVDLTASDLQTQESHTEKQGAGGERRKISRCIISIRENIMIKMAFVSSDNASISIV